MGRRYDAEKMPNMGLCCFVYIIMSFYGTDFQLARRRRTASNCSWVRLEFQLNSGDIPQPFAQLRTGSVEPFFHTTW